MFLADGELQLSEGGFLQSSAQLLFVFPLTGRKMSRSSMEYYQVGGLWEQTNLAIILRKIAL
jgi:hypothetical protein